MGAKTHTLNKSPASRHPVSKLQQQGVLQRRCACGNQTSQGECHECNKNRLSLQCVNRSFSIEENERQAAPSIVNDVLNSSGQPLDPTTRAFFARRFAADFTKVSAHGAKAPSAPPALGISHPHDAAEIEAERTADSIMSASSPVLPQGLDFNRVRIHSDARANESARVVNALAYTVGNNIVFGAGQYRPESTAGRRLLAHELVHVVQQQSATAPLRLARVALSPADFGAMAEALHTALAGTTSDNQLVFVTFQKLERDATAITTLRTTYRRQFNTDLEPQIRRQMSGVNRALALELLGINPRSGPTIARRPPGSPAEFQAMARRLDSALSSTTVDERAVYAPLMSLNRNASLATQLKTAYQNLVHRALEDDLRSKMSATGLPYALYLLNAPPPATGGGSFQTVSGSGTAPSTPPPAVEGGQVTALTQVQYPTPGASGGTASLSFGVTYQGGLAAESRWLQFIWREIQVTARDGTVRMLTDPVTIGARTYPLTTNSSSPNFSVDSRSSSDPFYEASTSTSRREPDLTMIGDAPTPIRSLVAREFANGARSVVSREHFEIYLIRDYRTLYHIGIDIEHNHSSATNYRTIRQIRVTEVASRLPADARTALTRDYPAYSFIQ